MATATNRRIADIINDIEDGRLRVRPPFQRRLVWTNHNKEHFIDSILEGLPFPEIFVATGEFDVDSIKRVNYLVDGQQRISTIHDYVRDKGGILHRSIPKFSDLSSEKKQKFLDYPVAVRDLGTIGEDGIKLIFQRINSTDYSLKAMEKLNAMYSGEFSRFCEKLSKHSFFEDHMVFKPAHTKRMMDVTFCVILVATILGGYYRRDERNEEFLQRYNDDFPESQELSAQLSRTFSILDQCQVPEDSLLWGHTNLFSAIVEIHNAIVPMGLDLDTEKLGRHLTDFFENVQRARDLSQIDKPSDAERFRAYLKASTKATNDKYSRIERASILAEIIHSCAN